MSIGARILFGCFLLTLLTSLLGAYGQWTERQLGSLVLRIYDDAFMGMSYLRSAQIEFATMSHSARGAAADPAAISAVVDDLSVARDRAMSAEGRRAAVDISRALNGLTPRQGHPVTQHDWDEIQASFERAVETFAADGFRYRRDASGLIARQARQTSIVFGASIAGMLLITFLLTRTIAPPVRRAVRIAQAIADGQLDNAIVVNGHGETGDLLRALSIMQASIAAALARIHSLMQQQADSHAGEMAEQHARMEAALNNMSQGLCLFSAAGDLVVTNQRFVEMFGAPRHRATTEAVFQEAGLEMLMPSVRDGLSALTCELPDGRSIAMSQQPIPAGGLVVTLEDISERRRTEERLAYLARHDALTGLPNRLLFNEHIAGSLARARRGDGIALLCLDLDRFKVVNDTMGHAAGDTLLKAVAERLRQQARETDLVIRLGGDEFIVIQEKASIPADTTALARRIIDILGRPFVIDGQDVAIGVSIGISLSAEGVESPDDLLQHADLALYRAKNEGRGTFRFFEREMDEAMQRKRALERDLRNALVERRLEVYYQPLVRPEGVAGFEALVRWNHPERGQISPAVFIPVAEECGLIGPIGAWVLEQACRDAASWPGRLKVAINLSPAQFQTRSLVADTEHALQLSGLAPERLELEITESMLIQDSDSVLTALHALRAKGIRIAMDDFGTGYSSLSYLRRFPFDKIKIDQSFVKGIGDQEECRTIVRAVIGLGRALHMAVNAEGVETQEQLEALRSEGCAEIQGYFFSRPRPAAEIAGLLDRLGNATLQHAASAPAKLPRPEPV
jgi:diguanylate cyclase (GGDEF)-like protein